MSDKLADCVAPPYPALIVIAAAAVTVPVCAPKNPLLCPAGMKNTGGTGNRAAFALERVTDAPPSGAGPLSLRTTSAVFPPMTLDGLKPTLLRLTLEVAGVTEMVATWLDPP